jgi:hypothetical protein
MLQSQLDTSGSVSPTDSCLLPVTSQPFSMNDGQKSLPRVGAEQSNKTSAAKELDLILIADFIGRQELKIRIKQNEGLPGAKVTGTVLKHFNLHFQGPAHMKFMNFRE